MSNATQQTIDVGAVANDGTGESLRDAFNAVNNNFANVWAAGPVGSNVVIRNNEVTTNVTNLDLKIAGNGVGNVVVASTMQPTIDGVYDLGRPNQAFGEVHAGYYYGNGAFLTGVGSQSFTEIIANGEPVFANANAIVNFVPGNNMVMLTSAIAPFSLGSGVTNTIEFAVEDNPSFANVTATNFNGVSLAVSDATVYGNVNALQGNFTNLITTPAANIANLYIDDNVIGSVGNANIVLDPGGAGVVESTGNIHAPYIFGNLVGNITGNLTVAGANTGVVFNDGGTADAVAGFTFDKTTSAVSVTGNVTAADFNGAGYGLNYVMADRGGDTTNWNVLLKMGTYTVNRTNWGGVTGAPVDSNVYVGLLEVKVANTQGAVLSVQQSFYPGTVTNDVKIQFNRSYWNGTWTPWIRITNNDQTISGGSF